MRMLFLMFFLEISAKGVAGDVSCESLSSLNSAYADNPVVKVAPEYPNNGTKTPVPGCAVLTFSLDRLESASTPKSIEVEYETENRFGKAAKRALTKWLYLNKSVPESDRYYMVFHFDLTGSRSGH